MILIIYNNNYKILYYKNKQKNYNYNNKIVKKNNF